MTHRSQSKTLPEVSPALPAAGAIWSTVWPDVISGKRDQRSHPSRCSCAVKFLRSMDMIKGKCGFYYWSDFCRFVNPSFTESIWVASIRPVRPLSSSSLIPIALLPVSPGGASSARSWEIVVVFGERGKQKLTAVTNIWCLWLYTKLQRGLYFCRRLSVCRSVCLLAK